MGLWIFAYDDADADEIEKACAVAAGVLQAAGTTPGLAQEAAHEAADLSIEFDGATPNGDLVILWFKAEYAAFEYLQSVTNEWPNGASLIYVEDQS
ncbi:hypothetical protein [Stenotrophomonas oahuensis]|uniref:Uncharacterized protein n=1 Tax=Stenotrophomonas oahuensis TaxID=3003271 RepID=A0ABY9YVW5_9GAMM|nr:hypothetical protein [Stenotrophomonas sp. A5586]WNH54832.1 hypothetical protein PDM29_20680 [Stenotrophomonas sp. A5586]